MCRSGARASTVGIVEPEGGMLGQVIRGGIEGNHVCLEWGGEFGPFHTLSERMLAEKAEYEYAATSLVVKPESASPPYSSCPRIIL